MIGLILSSLLLTIGLGELYVRWSSLLGASAWLSILCLHGIMVLGLLVFFDGIKNQLRFKASNLSAFIPAVLILVGTYVLIRFFPVAGLSHGLTLPYMLASCTIVPFVEEVVFRGGVSAALDRVQPSSWSGYFSAMVFSIAHTTPSWSRILDLKVGLPLGPFLLGIVCEYLTRKSKSLLPAIAFHCACNSTVIIFNQWSPGWLQKLSIFYLG